MNRYRAEFEAAEASVDVEALDMMDAIMKVEALFPGRYWLDNFVITEVRPDDQD